MVAVGDYVPVVISGLVGAPELNGKNGVVYGFKASKADASGPTELSGCERFVVMVEVDGGQRKMALKLKNVLQLCFALHLSPASRPVAQRPLRCFGRIVILP